MHDKNTIHELIREFYPYVKEQLGFQESCKVFLRENQENCADPLGKTAYYDPQGMEIHLYITMRHPKDVLRSFSHELVHHNQNCRGDFDGAPPTTEGYAQTDEHLRKMEKEAYLEGNILLRDWCDNRKKNNQGLGDHRGSAQDAGSIGMPGKGHKEKPLQKYKWYGPAGGGSSNTFANAGRTAAYTKGNRDIS